MTRVITQSAPAKINLYLHVTGKRDDGYHLLDSIAVFARDIADTVTIREGNGFSFSISGLFSDDTGDHERNLSVRAARLYGEVTGQPLGVSLHLEKNIPAGAGLGGGSSDAAATIKALEQFYETQLPERGRHLLSLGADVPVCYRARACRFKGVGEIITDIPPIPSLTLLIVWPNVHSSTQDVFAARDSAYNSMASIPPSLGSLQQLLFFLKSTSNDLEAPACAVRPVIAEAKELVHRQNGCMLSRMTGSGSAVFGLFASEGQAVQAREEILAIHAEWWAQTTAV
jgi:4-diphosphocytidyl-2-C-methyl-D-erythritol kinase